MRHLLRSVIVVAALSIACVKTGSSVERVPISENIAQYRTASAQLDIPHDVKDPHKLRDRFFETLGEELADRKLFRLQGDGAELLIRVKVTHVEAGSRAAMAFNVGGDAEIAATVELVDLRQQKTIGVFDVTGNSKKQGNSHVGGVNTKVWEDNTGRAFGAAAEEIAGFLEKQRK